MNNKVDVSVTGTMVDGNCSSDARTRFKRALALCGRWETRMNRIGNDKERVTAENSFMDGEI